MSRQWPLILQQLGPRHRICSCVASPWIASALGTQRRSFAVTSCWTRRARRRHGFLSRSAAAGCNHQACRAEQSNVSADQTSWQRVLDALCPVICCSPQVPVKPPTPLSPVVLRVVGLCKKALTRDNILSVHDLSIPVTPCAIGGLMAQGCFMDKSAFKLSRNPAVSHSWPKKKKGGGEPGSSCAWTCCPHRASCL